MPTSVLLGLVLHLTAITDLNYGVHPVPLADRTRLDITLSFMAKPGEELEVELPRDVYGTPSLYRFVESFEGTQGTKVGAGRADASRKVTAGPDGAVNLKYVLSCDPAKLENATFSPNVSPHHFHVAGSQWMLRIGDLSEQRQHRIRIQDAPKGWKFYSPMGQDAANLSVKASYNDLSTKPIGGAGRGFYEFHIRGKRVTVSIPHSLRIPDEKVVESVRKIIDLQRKWFADDSDDYFHVAINPKEDSIAGYCVRHHFVCFIKDDITQDQFNVLAAHEMFHNWMGQQIAVEAPKGEFALKYQWFSEGVNEYFGRKLLLEAGLISKDLYAELFNTDILNLRDNPNAMASLNMMSKAMDEGRFDTSFTKVAYYRGALIALKWDSELRASRKPDSSLFLRELFKLSKHGTEVIPEATFFAVANKMGISVKRDLERYILKGEAIQPGADWIGPEYTLIQEGILSYDLGFDLAASREKGAITGCKEGSNAHKAGLRDGMKLVSTGNSNRFANSWDKKKPFRVVVQDGGQERTIEYFPHGPEVKTPQYKRR